MPSLPPCAPSLRKLTVAGCSYLLVFGIVVGCSDSSTTDPGDQEETEHRHLAEPNSNDLVREEVIGTESDSNSSIWSTVDRPGGGQYFRGYHQGHWVVGAIGENHDIEWSRRTYYSTLSIQNVPTTASIPTGAFLISGNKDVDDDGWYDTGIVSIVGPNGNLVDELEWPEPAGNLRFADFLIEEQEDDTLQLLVGGTILGENDVDHPILATITVESDGTLDKGDLIRFPELENVHFWQPIRNPSEAIGGYVLSAGTYDADGDLLQSIVFGLDPDFDVTWQTPLDSGTGLFNRIDFGQSHTGMTDAIFCVGSTHVDRTNSSGAHWSGGTVFALSPSGDVSWSRTYDLSQWSDYFEDFRVEGSYLYVGGRCAAYQSDDRYYGYGWIGRIDPETGDLVSSQSFGADDCQSQLNCLLSVGATATGAGYTGWQADGAGFRHWIVNLEIADRMPVDRVTFAPRDSGSGTGDRRPPSLEHDEATGAFR
jgi:hypothetical protein